MKIRPLSSAKSILHSLGFWRPPLGLQAWHWSAGRLWSARGWGERQWTWCFIIQRRTRFVIVANLDHIVWDILTRNCSTSPTINWFFELVYHFNATTPCNCERSGSAINVLRPTCSSTQLVGEHVTISFAIKAMAWMRIVAFEAVMIIIHYARIRTLRQVELSGM